MNAAIDIGSNTVLLLIGETAGTKVNVIYDEHHAPRLGKGVDAEKNLHPGSVNRVIEVLQQYEAKIKSYPVIENTAVVATSAVRDANNQQEFVQRVEKETDFKVQVLSGEEEAELTYLGAKSVLDEEYEQSAAIDIGGGSTEIAIGKGDELVDRFSFDIGSVRFTERYLKNSPPTLQQIEECRLEIKQTLAQRSFEFSDKIKLIGVSGTVTSVAAIERELEGYKPGKINGIPLTKEDISSWIAIFSKMKSGDLLQKYPDILKGRGDVFLAGLLILEGFLNYYDIRELTVSTGGIRHGALLK